MPHTRHAIELEIHFDEQMPTNVRMFMVVLKTHDRHGKVRFVVLMLFINAFYAGDKCLPAVGASTTTIHAGFVDTRLDALYVSVATVSCRLLFCR